MSDEQHPAGPLHVGPFDAEPTKEIFYDATMHFGGDKLAAACQRWRAAAEAIPLGSYDRRIVAWVEKWDPPTIWVLASLLIRARKAENPSPGLSRESFARINAKINADFEALQSKLADAEAYGLTAERIISEQRGLLAAQKSLIEEFENRG